MTKLVHLSDTHGHFPQLRGKYQIILHSGDFFPNYKNYEYIWAGLKAKEAEWQLDWLEANIELMKAQVQHFPFLFTLGNHDFVDPNEMQEFLRFHGIQATHLHDRVVGMYGINFYGLPYIPRIRGDWNYELDIPEMQVKVDQMVATIEQSYIDIIVPHCPPLGILDIGYREVNIGNSALMDALNYKISKELLPQLVFFGHSHQSHGITMKNGILFVNSATIQNIVEI